MYVLLFPILFFLNMDCSSSFLKWQLVNFSTCLSKIVLCWGHHPNPEITENLWHFLSVIKYMLSITQSYLMHLKCIFVSKNLVQKTKGYRQMENNNHKQAVCIFLHSIIRKHKLWTFLKTNTIPKFSIQDNVFFHVKKKNIKYATQNSKTVKYVTNSSFKRKQFKTALEFTSITEEEDIVKYIKALIEGTYHKKRKRLNIPHLCYVYTVSYLNMYHITYIHSIYIVLYSIHTQLNPYICVNIHREQKDSKCMTKRKQWRWGQTLK